jgi:hypothetical protein
MLLPSTSIIPTNADRLIPFDDVKEFLGASKLVLFFQGLS